MYMYQNNLVVIKYYNYIIFKLLVSLFLVHIIAPVTMQNEKIK